MLVFCRSSGSGCCAEGIVFSSSDKHRGNSCGGAVFLQESSGAPGKRLAKHRKQSVAAGIEKALFFCTVSGTFSFDKTKENVGDMASGQTTLCCGTPCGRGHPSAHFVAPPLSSRIRFAGLRDELGRGDVWMDCAQSLSPPWNGESSSAPSSLLFCPASASLGCGTS